MATPAPTKRSRGIGERDDDDGDDDGLDSRRSKAPYTRRSTYDGDDYTEMDSPPPQHHDEDVFCSQADNPTPAAFRGRHAGVKQVQDRVHGQVTLDRLLVEVMDTPEFQRLDGIKQLGGCSYVYPSATHTRKEHSIGVAYLAGLMVKHLRDTQPHLQISDDDELCVKLAGLTHDIGHGPFSHMFEHFVHDVGEATGDERKKNYSHEDMSEMLLRYLIERNGIDLDAHFSEASATSEQHLNLVVQMIKGLGDDASWDEDKFGRPEEKRFLLDIVSNARSGVDVDKLDYLVRDAMSAFGSSKPPVFDIYRIINSSRVLRRSGPRRDGSEKPGEVCFQMKVLLDINEVYNMRTRLHQFVYQHRIANVAEGMITDVLKAAQAFTFRDSNGALTQLADAVHDPAAFTTLTDSVLDMIAAHSAEGLDAARALMRRLKSRDFYRQVGDHVKLQMLPTCFECGAETEFAHRFCHWCGRKTTHRGRSNRSDPVTKVGPDGVAKTIWLAPDDKDGALGLTNEKAKEELLECCEPLLSEAERERVFVHIVDIAHGKKTTVPDPHDETKVWRTYDPVARVGFFNPKEAIDGDEPPIKDVPRGQIPGVFLPAAQHLRTLYCYLKHDVETSRKEPEHDDGDDELYNRIDAALDQWKDTRKVKAQLGTANGTPCKSLSQSRQSSQHASQHASQQPSQHGTPRQSQTASQRQQHSAGPSSRTSSQGGGGGRHGHGRGGGMLDRIQEAGESQE